MLFISHCAYNVTVPPFVAVKLLTFSSFVYFVPVPSAIPPNSHVSTEFTSEE